MKFGVGTIQSFNSLTGDGQLIAHNGQLATLNQEVAKRFGIAPEDVGRRVSFQANDGRHVLQIERLQFLRNAPDQASQWPAFGDLVRVICTVSHCNPDSPLRYLWHPNIDREILVRPKRDKRRDLRTGDKVIAEVIRWNKGLLAIRAVRLPKDYLSKTAEHAHLLSKAPCA
ncbi:MAG: hypothetical protein ABL973_00130 [Micropepsaceae bacterium]